MKSLGYARTLTACLASALLCPAAGWELQAQSRQPRTSLLGFQSQAVAQQLEYEKIFAEMATPRDAERHHRILTEEPHIEGQPSQRKVAEYVRDRFIAAGVPAEIVEYRALLPYPKSASVTLLEPEERRLDLHEDGYDVDKDSFSDDVVAPFNAYSPSGDVQAQVVYANYGLPEDYEKLKALGIEIQGKIVLVRYGRSFRGVKVKVAEEQGAAGVLIYSDPFDDGYFRGDVFPDGPMRPRSAVQRGSVQYLFVYPGDPLTPATPALENADRLPQAEAGNIPRIPSQPLSYGDASQILSRLRGPVVPSGWQGALPFAYHVGPGPSRVHMKIEMDYAVRPVWDVVGRIEGAVRPDEWVVLGNHIDAWTYGGVDPNSGTTSLLLMVQGFGKLLQQGDRPRRTIILAAWGGEEYGLIGSTEWGEEHREALMRQAVAYVNVDAAVSGNRFSAAAVPSLEPMLREVLMDVRDPLTRKSIYEAWLDNQRERSDDANDDPPLTVPDAGDLGSGSDYTVFLDHLGIPSISMGFNGPYGVYHSIYDSHYWMDRFGDPGWEYHPLMAEIWGRVALRLANADFVPFDFAEYGRDILRHLEALKKETPEGDDYAAPWDDLKREAENLRRIGDDINAGVAKLAAGTVEGSKARRVNELLREAEKGFLLDEGLPRRPWFRHAIYAPGFYTGYSSLPLPGPAQAVKDKDGPVFRKQISALLDRLKRVNRTLDQVRRLTQ